MSLSRIVAVAVLATSLAGPAFAFHCPADMAKIDAALPNAQLSEADRAKVMELRKQGEELHKAGQHQASIDALAQAMQLMKL
jgi:hypothetical protein